MTTLTANPDALVDWIVDNGGDDFELAMFSDPCDVESLTADEIQTIRNRQEYSA